MTSALSIGWRRAAIVLAALGMSLLTGRALLAQDAEPGVAAWQAERMIKDYVHVFAAQQGIVDPGTKVRVKVSEVRRNHTPDGKYFVVAIFEGAVVPDVYTPQQTQTYYHGILRISADSNGNVQDIVVNEGQGLWKMTTTSAQLHEELSEKLGDWADWGGNPADIPPSADETIAPESPSDVGPGPSSGHGSSGGDDIKALEAEVDAAKRQCDASHNSDDCDRYTNLYKKYIDRMQHP